MCTLYYHSLLRDYVYKANVCEFCNIIFVGKIDIFLSREVPMNIRIV